MTKKEINVVDAICKASLLENSLTVKTGTGVIQDLVEEAKTGGIKSKPILFPGTSYHIISLQDEPVSIDTFQSFDPNVRSTFGKFMLTFLCKSDNRVRKGRRFVIDQDLIRARIFFYNYKELKHIASKVPEIGWLLRNSTLTEELLEVAIQHVGIPFVFTIDWVRYAKKIKESAEKKEIDIQQKPFVTFQASKETCKPHENKLISDRRNINDYTADIGDLYNNKPEDYEDDEVK